MSFAFCLPLAIAPIIDHVETQMYFLIWLQVELHKK